MTSGASVMNPTALVVVDMQTAFVVGESALPTMSTMLPAIEAQLAAAREAGALVVFLQNDGPAGASDEQSTDGWRLALDPEAGEVVIRKSQDSGFAGTDLDHVLQRHRVQVVSLCGLMSEMCVAATARDAIARDYVVVLAHDSHGTYDVPPFVDGEAGVPAEQAARVVEWSLGDTIVIAPSAAEVRFAGADGEALTDTP